ncbi:MAG TPA: lipid A biosynthesis acyltransferase [Burkholderiales bacterium]|nr:lipid A biosynthesis acyltransferase [Burkholderiales bacterium]
MTRLVFWLMWLVHFLPFRGVAAVGSALGAAAFWLIPERRHVTRINLAKCFPQLDERSRERIARAHFRAFGRSFFDRGILWWAPRSRVRRLVHVEGIEHLRALAGRRVVILAPHFVGLDAAPPRLLEERDLASMYARQKDPLFERLMYEGRVRFGGRLYPRQAGIRKVLREVKDGVAFYYLPDMDLGPKGAVFVPFFGVPAATTVGLSYIARSTAASIVPCVTRMLPGGGYVARLYPAWSDFPSGDDTADARRLLAFIEERVREMPEQYLWMHKRFKTRPPGEPKFY